jgi:hypothetical protein
LPEAATVLSYKVSHKAAKDFLDDKITGMADEIFLSQNKKG